MLEQLSVDVVDWCHSVFAVLLCFSGDTDASDYKGRDDYDAAAGYGYDDAKEYEPGAKYSPHYGAGGQYVMGAAKGSDSDTFVWCLTCPDTSDWLRLIVLMALADIFQYTSN